MTIVFLTPVGTLGGSERSLVDLAAALRKARPALPIHVIAGEDGPIRRELERSDVEFEVVQIPKSLAQLGESGVQWSHERGLSGAVQSGLLGVKAAFALPKYLMRLRSALLRIQPTVIHSNGMKSHIISGYVAPKNVPVVWHFRDFLSPRPLLGTWLRRMALRPSAIIANSFAVNTDVKKHYPETEVRTVYNGIDTTFFTPGPPCSHLLDELAGLTPASPNDIRVGLVATYARWKGQDVFIESAARLIKSGNKSIRFYIVGGPTYKTLGSQFCVTELRDQITNAGLNDHVGIIPFQDDLRNIYRSLDLVVHASTRAEPFGRTIAESMACGRAVLATLGGGAIELFTDGFDAIGVPMGDPNALSIAILGLCKNPERREYLAKTHATRRKPDFHDL